MQTNENAKRIATLLHSCNAGSSEKLRDLVAAIRVSTLDDIALGTLAYTHDLLEASQKVLTLQRDGLEAAIEHLKTGGRMQ